MLKDKRKRAVVLALLAFFCTAGASYIAVDWKRVGTSLASLTGGGSDDKMASKRAVAMAVMTSSLAAAKTSTFDFIPQDGPAQQPEVALMNTRRQLASVGGSAGSVSFKNKSEDDLFSAGDPAAGIPPGKFIVAQNDSPSAPADRSPPLPGGAGSGGGGVSFPAPAATGNGGAGGGGGAVLQPPVSSVPEASSLAMTGLGALLLAAMAARRRRQD